MSAAKASAMQVWPGDLSTLCSCILKVFEQNQTNLDNVMFRKLYEKESKDKVKVVEVHVTQTDSDLEVRRQTDWEGASKKERNSMHLIYWGIRTERQDLLLAEIANKIFLLLSEMGYTHVRVPSHDSNQTNSNDNTNDIEMKDTKKDSKASKTRKRAASEGEGAKEGKGDKYLRLESARVAGARGLPRGMVQMIKARTGTNPVPSGAGLPIHYVALELEDSSSELYAVTRDNDLLSTAFMIAPEKEMLEHMCFSHKPLYDQAWKEVDVTKKSALFKKKFSSFFENFSLDSANIKAAGNAEFEAHRYQPALLWYTLGISFELKNKESELLHVFYGNRSVTYLQLKDNEKALQDANEAIRVAPHWPKGYMRKSAVLEAMGQLKEAKLVLEEMDNVENAPQPKNKKRKT